MTSSVYLVSEWANAAENEALDQEYFFEPPQLAPIISGKKCIALGRKGSGKTALAHHLARQERKGIHSICLSLASIDFSDAGAPSSFWSHDSLVTAWTFAILRAACELFLEQKSATQDDQNLYAKIVGTAPRRSSAGSVADRVRSVRIDLGFFGFQVGMSPGAADASPNSSIETKIAALRDFIESRIFGDTYRIVFDGLDESYVDAFQTDQQQKFLRVVTALVSAAIRERNYFRHLELPRNFFPIVFLRSDIFSAISHAQRAAWRHDYSIDLSWPSGSLIELAEHRLISAGRMIQGNLTEKEAIGLYFKAHSGSVLDFGGTQRRMQLIRYVVDFCLGRPRDVVMYLALSAAECVERSGRSRDSSAALNLRVDKTLLDKARWRYGNFLKAELDDELACEYPGLRRLYNGLQALKRTEFSFDEFAAVAKQRLNSSMGDGDVASLAERLFDLSFFGHVLDGEARFPVREPVEFDENAPLCVHPCYAAALRIPTR